MPTLLFFLPEIVFRMFRLCLRDTGSLAALSAVVPAGLLNLQSFPEWPQALLCWSCSMCSPKPSLVVNTLMAAERPCAHQHTTAGDLKDTRSPSACAVRLFSLSVRLQLLSIEENGERWTRPWWCALGMHARVPCKKVVCSLAAGIKHRDCSTSSCLHLHQHCEYKPQLFPQFFQILTVLCYVSILILGPLLGRHKAPAGYVSALQHWTLCFLSARLTATYIEWLIW